MANHILSLEVPDTLNKCALRLVDTSIYMTMPAPQCPILLITLPGFNVPTQFTQSSTFDTGFILTITGCDLGIQIANCGTTYCDLPDGIYIIKYSVSPNDIVYVEYNHLRTTIAMNKIKKIYCDLDMGACEPQEKIKDKLNKLTLLERQLEAAKAKVEYCHEPKKGMDLYRYVVKQLDKMLCNSCSTC